LAQDSSRQHRHPRISDKCPLPSDLSHRQADLGWLSLGGKALYCWVARLPANVSRFDAGQLAACRILPALGRARRSGYQNSQPVIAGEIPTSTASLRQPVEEIGATAPGPAPSW
jgi:hypothetical protein